MIQKTALVAVAAVAFSSFVLSGCGSQANSATSVVPKNAVKVTVTAANFSWTLGKKTFTAGVPIDFQVTSKEGTHGFHIVGTNTRQTVSAGTGVQNVVWTPQSPGTYTIACDVFCGSGHSNMFTSFVVK